MKRKIDLPTGGLLQKRKPRCKQVLVILNNKLETLHLVREEAYQPRSDFDNGSLEVAVVRWHNGLLVNVPLDCVVFLHKGPNARAVTEKEKPRLTPKKSAARAGTKTKKL